MGWQVTVPINVRTLPHVCACQERESGYQRGPRQCVHVLIFFFFLLMCTEHTWECRTLQQVSVPHQLQHDCQQLHMFLTLPAFCCILLQQSLFSWLHHQHHLSTQQIRPFSDFLALVPRLYNYNSITQHKNTNPIQAMSHAIYLNIYWFNRGPEGSCLPTPGDKILAQLG